MATKAFAESPASRAGAGVHYPFRALPRKAVMGYLIAVFLIFLTWPVNWPLYGGFAWTQLVAYVGLCFAALWVGYGRGAALASSALPAQPFAIGAWVIALGASATMVMLFPTSFVYTGQWPWQVLDSLADQGEAYRALQNQLIETTGQRAPIAAARALLAPLTFAVLPLGILNWRRLSGFLKLLVIGAALSSVILSILRGTDRELADLFIIGSSAVLVTIGRQSAAGGRALELVKRYWLPAVLLAVFVWVAAGLFTDRKASRLGAFDDRVVVCANDSQICADMDAPLISWMPVEQRFGTSIFVLSSTSGFFGLALGMEKDFEPTWGTGHSPAALSVYELLTGDQSMRFRTFTYRNSFDNWSDENYWSTLILWIANDTGFVGAVLVLAIIGLLWGRTWRDATQGHSDPAAVLFCLLMVLLVYLPANNQVFAIYDGYTVFFVWLLIWLRQKRAVLRNHGRG